MKRTHLIAGLILVVACNLGRICLTALAEEPAEQTSQPAQQPRVAPYVIEPPDVLSIDIAAATPEAPRPLQAHDRVRIGIWTAAEVKKAPTQAPRAASLDIDADGNVDLGPLLGKTRLQGSTPTEAAELVAQQLGSLSSKAIVSVTLEKSASVRQAEGQHLVGPDGTVNLGHCGTVYVSGMTIDRAQAAIQKQLAKFLEGPKVALDVYAYNSKVYYVMVAVAGLRDNLVRLPITGNETVLDALAQINGLSRLSSKHIWIARPAPGGVGHDQILPVNFDDIIKGGATVTNYQVLPGDRIVVSDDQLTPLDDEPRARPRRVKPKQRSGARAAAYTETSDTD